jgi:hypothetical protein
MGRESGAWRRWLTWMTSTVKPGGLRCVGDAAVFGPEVVVHPAEVLAAEALGQEEVGVALKEGDYSS